MTVDHKDDDIKILHLSFFHSLNKQSQVWHIKIHTEKKIKINILGSGRHENLRATSKICGLHEQLSLLRQVTFLALKGYNKTCLKEEKLYHILHYVQLTVFRHNGFILIIKCATFSQDETKNMF